MKKLMSIIGLVTAFAVTAIATAEPLVVEEVQDMKTIYQHTLDETGAAAEALGPMFAGYDPTERRLSLLSAGRHTLAVIERPFIANPDAPDKVGGGIPYISSVPVGDYDLVLHDSPKYYGEQWHFVNPDLFVYLTLEDCPDYDGDNLPKVSRFSCMYHIANFVEEVTGCGGVGLRIHDWGNNPALRGTGLGVQSSSQGMVRLKTFLAGETRARLRIV